jgi:hypothetical protein
MGHSLKENDMPKKRSQSSLERLTAGVLESYAADGRTQRIGRAFLPSRQQIEAILTQIRELLFPGYFGTQRLGRRELRFHVGNLLAGLQDDLVELNRRFDVFQRADGTYKLIPGVADFWDRVLFGALKVCGHIFEPKGGHPLRIERSGKETWVTADDLDFMVLVFVQAITRMAWADRILPIGFIKDTNAFELVKAALPLLQYAGITQTSHQIPIFNSDKMLLQTNSVVNGANVSTPWHTVELDAAFRTMAPVKDSALPKGEGRVNGAYGNVVYPERVYVKTYIQLWSSASSPHVRSHVFTYDRPVYAGFDHWDEILLHNKDGTVDEEIRPVLHFREGSRVTNMVMAMLTEMGKEAIPEALGHNYPLFLADKKAKSILEETREAYLGAVAIEMARSDLDQQVLFSRRFRDYRSLVEGKRKR